MPKMQVPAKLKPLFQPKPIKIIYGGRGGGKSVTVADILLMRMITEGIKIGAMRELMNSIDDSVHALFSDEIERLSLPGFTVQNNTIFHESGGEIKYKGLSRNPEAVKSMHGFQVFWCEEASTLSKRSIDLLVPTLRADGAELWFTFNPSSSSDPIYEEWIKPFEKQLQRDGYYSDDMYTIIKLNYCDNPFFPEGLNNLRLKHKETKSLADYEHTWLGECADTIENSIIKPIWFDAAVDSHIKLGFKGKGALIAAHDPSDTGPDSKGYALRHGSVFLDIQEKITGDINEGCDWALDLAIQAQADHLVFDADGMGVALKRPIEQAIAGKKIESYMFKGSQSPDNPDEIYQGTIDSDKYKEKTNKETFKNKRAQYYMRLRDRFYNTYRAVEKGEYIDPDEMISIPSTLSCLAALRSEVCRIPLKDNGNGLIQIMPKPEMKKAGIESPNLADALMMTMIKPAAAIVTVDLSFDSEWN